MQLNVSEKMQHDASLCIREVMIVLIEVINLLKINVSDINVL